MRPLLTVLLLAFGLLAFAGCGGDDKPKVSSDEAKVIAAYNAANTAFRDGDFVKTCSFYTVELAQQLITNTKTKNCKQAFQKISENFKKAQPDPKVRAAIMSFGPEEARITGNRALAKFGAPPALVKKVAPETPDQGTVELRRTTEGRWLVATFIAAG